MKEIIYLIEIETLRNEYPFDDNLEDRYILPNIVKCQDIIVRPLLGDDYWEELTTQIKNNTVTDFNIKLINEYIQPLIAYYVMSECVYNTAYKLKNLGIEDGDSNKFNELVRLSKKYLIDSDQYQDRLKKYMILDTNLYPDPSYRYKTGIFLGCGLDEYDYLNRPEKKK